MALDSAQEKQLREAGFLIRNGRAGEAIPILDGLIEIDPDFLFLWDERVRAKAFSGDHAGALLDSTNRIRQAPNDPKGYTCRAFYVLARFGDIRAAVEDYSSAISLNPEHPFAYSGRGGLHVRLGNLSDAISDFTSDMRFSEHGALSGLLGRGKVRHLLGDLPGAIADLTEALHLEMNPVYAPLYRGCVLRAAGDYHGAIADFTTATHSFPELTNAYRLRAEARALIGDKVSAAEDFAVYQKLGGQDLPAYS